MVPKICPSPSLTQFDADKWPFLQPANKSGGQEGEKVGEGTRAAEDYRTAADILDIKGKEFQDESGHPESLYVAGEPPGTTCKERNSKD